MAHILPEVPSVGFGIAASNRCLQIPRIAMQERDCLKEATRLNSTFHGRT